MASEFITVVSGLPRSGTSMMMLMLHEGGLPILTDGIRESDDDNPMGYFEFERVKALSKGDVTWVSEARGRAVKVISYLLEELPPGETYRIVFMRRAMPEILASQRKMLHNRGEGADALTDDQLAAIFARHVAKVEAWLRAQSNVAVLEVDYNQVLVEPRAEAARVAAFLAAGLDVDAMAAVADPSLWRNRASRESR